ncbi:hypothetical protein K9L67_04080 [Candidatus Woesearchaeota archaeon]|nr:hypothetical protein [Candidatus Woesearchaeota archaeon]MCF7901380.1 hypothetical protein [Candidatus Woesearchaeota archaeon]MCF8013149.1 hypothetical protein [Candidatus Woesearchaeota archaeon]
MNQYEPIYEENYTADELELRPEEAIVLKMNQKYRKGNTKSYLLENNNKVQPYFEDS